MWKTEKEKEQNKGPKKWGYELIDFNKEGEKEKFGSKRNKEVRHEIPNEQGSRNESQRILTIQEHKKGIYALFFSSFTCFFLWQLSLRIAGIQVFQEALSCIPEDLSQTDVSLWEFEIHSPFLNWPWFSYLNDKVQFLKGLFYSSSCQDF